MQRRLINVHSYTTLERKLVGTENRGLGTPPHSENFLGKENMGDPLYVRL